MHRYSIMAMNTAHLEEICQDIRQQYENGVADLALFMVKLVPEGNPVAPKAEYAAADYVLFRDRLAEMGLKCGILVQCTIGHDYKLSERAPFQHYEKLVDGTTTYTVCPYDTDFQTYIRHSFAVLAKVKPEMIMVDDDFRLIQRQGQGCTCPLHLKQTQQEYGAPLTRKRILQAVRGKCEEDRAITDAFVKTQINSLLESARAMREGIDSVDKTLPGTYCTCGISVEGAVEIGRILAGEGNPVVIRVNNGNYTPAGARFLTDSFQRAAIEVTVMNAQGGADFYLAETDTCPQNRYSTGAQSLHSHYTGTILEGISGAKHWITKLNEYQPRGGIAYRKILSKYRGFYDVLMQLVPTLQWRGCRAPLSTVPDYCFRGSSATNDWVHCVLERLGLPVYFSAEDGGAAFLERDGTENFTKEELGKMLSGTLVLDGYAAKNLQERGLGQYLGVQVRPWNGAAVSAEFIGHPEKRVPAQIDCMELACVPDAQAQSTVYNIPDGKTKIPLFPGSVLYRNELGGTVLTFAGSAKTEFQYTQAFSFLDESRKNQLIEMLKLTGNLPVYYPDDAEVYLKAADMPDGALFVAFFNIGLDPIEEITLVAERTVSFVEWLTPEGRREPVPFREEAGTLILDLPAYTLNPVILFLR